MEHEASRWYYGSQHPKSESSAVRRTGSFVPTHRLLVELLVLSAIVCATLCSSLAAYASDDDTSAARVIIAGHPGAFEFARTERMAITVDSAGAAFMWTLENDSSGWSILGGTRLPHARDLRVYNGNFYVRIQNDWRELDETFALHAVVPELSTALDTVAPMTPDDVATFSSPIAATPLSISADASALVTDLGCISLENLELLSCSDSARSTSSRSRRSHGPGSTNEFDEPDAAIEAARSDGPGRLDGPVMFGGHIPIEVTSTLDPTCGGGVSFSVIARFVEDDRVLVRRSCRYARPTPVRAYDGSVTLMVFFASQSATSGVDASVYFDAAVRFDANLNPVQRIKLGPSLQSVDASRLTCAEEQCILDTPGLQRSYQWPSGVGSADASVVPYAIYRSARGSIVARSGEIVLKSASEEMTLIASAEGGATTCAWSPRIESRILLVTQGAFSIGADSRGRSCELALQHLARAIVLGE